MKRSPAIPISFARVRRRVILTLLLLQLFFAAVCICTVLREDIPSRDAIYYCDVVDHLYHAGVANWREETFSGLPPLFFFLMLLGRYLGLSSMAAGLTISIGSGCVLIAVIFRCVRTFTGSIRQALCAAVLTASLPFFLKLGTQMLRDLPYYVCYVWFLEQGYSALKTGKLRHFLLAAAAMSLEMLLRKEGLELLPAWGICSLWVLFRGGNRVERRKIWTGLVCGGLTWGLITCGFLFCLRSLTAATWSPWLWGSIKNIARAAFF